MTVCIAAIAERSFIVGVSDRMLTAGDVEFEPDQGKFWSFTNSIIGLVAGDTSIQGELLRETGLEVKDWLRKDVSQWIKVKDVAGLYCQKFREKRRKAAEAKILHPLGLTLETFLEKQNTLQPDLVSEIASKLTGFEFETLNETIFMGIDTNGPLSEKGEILNYAQLYVTRDDHLSWLTIAGFAAIGTGRSHAESQLMFSKHTNGNSFSDTVLLAYAAKKRAEAAPGVGSETDMIIVGPRRGESYRIEEHHLKQLDAVYRKARKTGEKAIQTAQSATQKLVKSVAKEREAENQEEGDKSKTDDKKFNVAS